MQIRLLTLSDGAIYRDLRLEALKESPTAFYSSYEQEIGYSMEDFVARLRPHGDPANGVFGAFEGERLIGMLGFSRENRPKRAHCGSVWGMYVRPEFRRRGIGAALLDGALAHGLALGSVRKIMLMVTQTNLAARSLYTSRGFECFGFERDALFVNSDYLDEEHMVFFLNQKTTDR